MNTQEKIARLKETVKYGETIAPYGPNLWGDLLDALTLAGEALDAIQDAAELFPCPEQFDELGEHLVANPAAFNTFAKIIKEIEDNKTRIEEWTKKWQNTLTN